jgi:hypothetical protein
MAVKAQNNIEPEVWRDIDIVCPICQIKKSINIPMRIIDDSKQLTSILIPIGRICEHTFIPFIDKHFKVRGYQKLDALLEDIEPKTESFIGLKPQDIDVIEIKMNIKPEMILYALRGCLFKKKLLIIIEKELEYLKDTIFDFFDYIFQKSFNTDILILIKEEYRKNKKIYGEFLVLEGKNIIGKTKKSINIKELKIEGEIVRDFYREVDSISGLKNLKDELRQIYALSHKLLEFYQKQGKQQPLQTRKAIRYLEDTHFIKIKRFYLQFLIKVIDNYFNTSIILVQDKLAEKIDHMWG